MYKFMAICALIVCSQAAPTDKPIESDSTVAFVATEKSISHDHDVLPTETLSTEKREKREDDAVSPSTTDNKRVPALSQQDYQENKPPTFVHPVPVDQIIKNSNASPQIHSSGPVADEEKDVETTVEEDVKATNDDEDTEQQKPKPKRVYNKHTLKTNAESGDDNERN